MKQTIQFKDFNFKLAVIDELMYIQELIEPKIDAYEFAENYKGREIDIEEEGHEAIPEILAYFQQLEIDQSLAKHITEIYQDGGNEIYMNIIPFWDGEDDNFIIESYEDAQYFPNLKEMTVFVIDDEEKQQLESRGIQVDLL